MLSRIDQVFVDIEEYFKKNKEVFNEKLKQLNDMFDGKIIDTFDFWIPMEEFDKEMKKVPPSTLMIMSKHAEDFDGVNITKGFNIERKYFRYKSRLISSDTEEFNAYVNFKVIEKYFLPKYKELNLPEEVERLFDWLKELVDKEKKEENNGF